MIGTKIKTGALIVCFCLPLVACAGFDDWIQYGRVGSRESIAVDGPNIIDTATLAWDANTDPQDPDYYVEFEGSTGAVFYNSKVYAYARYYDEQGVDTNSQIIAYDANSGQILWAGIIEKAYLNSWSTPGINPKNNTVLIGSGYKVNAFDADSGTELWSTLLTRKIVNASVCVVFDTPHARAFITDYKPYSDPEGRLYCINLDPYDEEENPYQQGEIIWMEIIGRTSGNTPAYSNGVVYVATVTGTDNATGTIYAYDAMLGEPNRLWQSTSTEFEGFFGGVTVTKAGYLYAATYDYDTSGGENNSTLCKIDCNDGSIIWTIATERTNSTPVVAGDKVYISGGVSGEYGSRPKVQAYQDNGTGTIKLWETLDDTNNPIGGWTHQPVYANGKLYTAAIKGITDKFSPYTDFYILDVSYIPGDADFIIDHYQGCGNSPVVTCDSIYATGYDGLFKFYQQALLGDISKDGRIDIYDMGKLADVWLYDGAIGSVRSDMNLDGNVDFIDFSLMANQWLRELN